jgi:hypothetical protein
MSLSKKILKFQKKQGIANDEYLLSFAGNKLLVHFSRYSFSYDDIKYDLTRKIKKGIILDWFNNHADKMSYSEYVNSILNKNSDFLTFYNKSVNFISTKKIIKLFCALYGMKCNKKRIKSYKKIINIKRYD